MWNKGMVAIQWSLAGYMNILLPLNPNPKIQHAEACRRARNLIRELRKSVIKAVIQAYELINSLKNNPDTRIKCCNHFSLLIVTYSDLYLGVPQRIWEEFLKEAVLSDFNAGQIDETALPPERIFIISIDEIEIISEKLGNNVFTLPDFIQRAVENNRNPIKQKMQLQMHVAEIERANYKEVDFVASEFEAFFNRMKSEILI